MHDASIDWLIDRLKDRLIDWLIDWSIERSFDWLIDWLAAELIDWLLFCWSVAQFTKWSENHQLIRWLRRLTFLKMKQSIQRFPIKLSEHFSRRINPAFAAITSCNSALRIIWKKSVENMLLILNWTLWTRARHLRRSLFLLWLETLIHISRKICHYSYHFLAMREKRAFLSCFFKSSRFHHGFFNFSWFHYDFLNSSRFPHDFFNSSWMHHGFFNSSWMHHGFLNFSWLHHGFLNFSWFHHRFFKSSWLHHGLTKTHDVFRWQEKVKNNKTIWCYCCVL